VDTLSPTSQGAGVQPSSLEGRAPNFSYAFQPIVDTVAREVFSYEALIRGPAGESAWSVLGRVPSTQRYLFDRDSRVAAIALAAKLGVNCHLNLNFLPQGLYLCADSVSAALEAAARSRLPVERIILEVTEGEVIDDQANFSARLNEFRSQGLSVAIDDFGAGYAGLNLLADFQPDQIKIDMTLVRGIERHGPRQAIVRAIIQVCADLGVDVIAEGIETLAEYLWFSEQGVRLFQGYLFARPGFECLPPVHYPGNA
jgi:EAL domain-containing protein (putative c-di-GMP-specific phosphodiesterase class I)